MHAHIVYWKKWHPLYVYFTVFFRKTGWAIASSDESLLKWDEMQAKILHYDKIKAQYVKECFVPSYRRIQSKEMAFKIQRTADETKETH